MIQGHVTLTGTHVLPSEKKTFGRSRYSSDFQLPLLRSSEEQRAQGQVQTAYGKRSEQFSTKSETLGYGPGNRMNKTSPPPVLLFPSIAKREIFDAIPRTSWSRKRSKPKTDSRTIYHLTRDKSFYRYKNTFRCHLETPSYPTLSRWKIT